MVIYNFVDFKIIELNKVSNQDLFYHILKISGLGSFLMFYGMYIRPN